MARQKKSKLLLNERLHILVSSDLRKAIDAAAQEKEMETSAFVRFVLRAYIEGNKK